jgi:hypothetical protein
MIPVINGIEEPVGNQIVSADSLTVVTGEDAGEHTGSQSVPTRVPLNEEIAHGQCF